MPVLPGYTIPAGTSRTTAAWLQPSPHNSTPCYAGCKAPVRCGSRYRLKTRHGTRPALRSSSSCSVLVRFRRPASARSQHHANSTACTAAAAAESTATVTSVGLYVLQILQLQVAAVAFLSSTANTASLSAATFCTRVPGYH